MSSQPGKNYLGKKKTQRKHSYSLHSEHEDHTEKKVYFITSQGYVVKSRKEKTQNALRALREKTWTTFRKKG